MRLIHFLRRFTFGPCPYCGRTVRARGFAPIARHVVEEH